MNKYDEGMALLAEKFGNNKDNLIALATIAKEPSAGGNPRPIVRDVDAYYEDGVFYVVTYGQSNKMQEIAKNPEVAIAVSGQWFNGSAIGENLGWCLKPENAGLRDKLRKAFEAWYDFANNEKDENCCYLAIRMTSGIINIDHFKKLYFMDFANKTATVKE